MQLRVSLDASAKTSGETELPAIAYIIIYYYKNRSAKLQ